MFENIKVYIYKLYIQYNIREKKMGRIYQVVRRGKRN